MYDVRNPARSQTAFRHVRAFAVTACAILAMVAIGAAPQAARAADDVVRLRPSGSVTGTISEMTPVQVAVAMAGGQRREVPVNTIDAIQYDGEPAEIRLVRSAIANGAFENAITQLDRIDASQITRSEIVQDLQFYKALCRARLALRGQGDVREAGTLMRGFVTSYPNNYHYLEAAELLGDLFAAIGAFDRAFEQYAAVEKAPWPGVQMRAGVAKGRVLLAQKKHAEALAAFDAVLKLVAEGDSPDVARQRLAAQLGKATCQAATGQPDEAITLVQQVIEQADPEEIEINARAYLTLGNCYRQRPDGATDALLEYLRVHLLYNRDREAHAEALFHLATLFNERGQPERAAEATQLLKQNYADTPWAR